MLLSTFIPIICVIPQLIQGQFNPQNPLQDFKRLPNQGIPQDGEVLGDDQAPKMEQIHGDFNPQHQDIKQNLEFHGQKPLVRDRSYILPEKNPVPVQQENVMEHEWKAGEDTFKKPVQVGGNNFQYQPQQPANNLRMQNPQQESLQNSFQKVPLVKPVPVETMNKAHLNEPEAQQPPFKKPVKLAESLECAADVKTLCSDRVRTNNFEVLDCLQNDLKADQAVSSPCQNFLWHYKKNLTNDIRFDGAAGEVCKDDLKRLSECNNLERGKGQVISCLIENRPNISNQACNRFLVKMSSIVFSDYHLVNKFAEFCYSDIETLKCGRLTTANDASPHSQGHTIECLSDSIKDLSDTCKHEILRIAELQADDYHMDRPLFYACREDREMFCQHTRAGDGKVYNCLFRHKFDRGMSNKCRDQLVRRQKLMQVDYKINKEFAEDCGSDIKTHKCFAMVAPTDNEHFQMSTVLLCLERELKDNGPASIAPECMGQMSNIRRSLLSDYQISPNIIEACQKDITDFCNGGIEREGKTLHCLMDAARPDLQNPDKQRLSSRCMRELEGLLLEADVGTDIELDPILHEACASVADHVCRGKQNDHAEVMECLMDHLNTNDMTDDCQNKLIEVQYFISRDFNMDPRLYKYCHVPAAKFCHASDSWLDQQNTNPEQGPLVFSCLYRHWKHFSEDPELQLSRACQHEVRRVMRQRAASVELNPDIEINCMNDLAAYCSAKLERGEEMHCLQDNFDKLSPGCRSVVGNITQDQDMDPNLDRILMKACTPMITMFCKDLLKNDNAEASSIMECLIDNKNEPDMDEKCHSGIEHHQLITLKDYKFSFKFKEACKGDIDTYCSKERKKSEVVKCLSLKVREDRLLDRQMRISEACHKQLRRQLIQRSENIRLDPDLNDNCGVDVSRFCSNVSPGRSAITECLQKHQKELEEKCHDLIFKREVQEVQDPGTDYLLFTSCKRMIKKHCSSKTTSEVFRCLKHHKEDEDFDEKCRKVIVLRQRMRSKDVRLNPALEKACKMDMNKFCSGADLLEGEAHEVEGRFLQCLKIKFAQKRLSTSCTSYVSEIIRDAELDYKQDSPLSLGCSKEIREFCTEAQVLDENSDMGGEGAVSECLKQHLLDKKITNPGCVTQIARVLAEDKADVHVDPLLHKACSLDLTHYCKDVDRGMGRQMSCLLVALDDREVRLQPQCRRMLQDRVTMWEYAAKAAPPDTLGEVIDQLAASTSRNYFLIIFMSFIAFIFFGGLCCGRVTKRVSYSSKVK